MIFPVLAGLLSPLKTPFTVFLLLVNIFVFLATLREYQKSDDKIEAILQNDKFLETQGVVFASLVEEQPNQFSVTLHGLARQALEADLSARKILGSLAMRNALFMRQAALRPMAGDEIAFADWRKDFLKLERLQDEHPSYLWGIYDGHDNGLRWLTYQFSHSGFAHLFWNMIFLLIFGTFIEARLGGSFVMISYVGGGLVGAFAFSKLSGISASPLVGASAAISALISLVAFSWLRRGRLRFFYWLLPIQGFFGFVFLPSWFVLLVSIIPDLTGFFSATPDMGSIAYAAHIGGAAWGAAIALLYNKGLLKNEESEIHSEPSEMAS